MSDDFQNVNEDRGPIAVVKGFFSQANKMGNCAFYTLSCCGCITLLGEVALFILLGLYAFKNPDNDGWYATVPAVDDQGDAYQAPGMYDSESIPEDAIDVSNVHSNFVTWFMWGFFNHALVFGIPLAT